MIIKKVENKKELIRFVDFPDKLYKDDPNYVPYIRSDLISSLDKLLFAEKTYTALIALDSNKNVLGRVLFTIAKNKQLKTDRCGFFSLYECIDDTEVSSKLIGKMEEELRLLGAEYISGTYFPYDPDNRRGIMVQGFERAPLIFTSYNCAYYDAQMTNAGLKKHLDTYEFSVTLDSDAKERLASISERSTKRLDYRVDYLNKGNVKQDITDICDVMKAASTEINYQDAPDYDVIEKAFNDTKLFLEPSLILIARRNSDNKPIGMIAALPDYFQVIKKINGRLNPINLLRAVAEKGKIDSCRCMLQYVLPEYQKKGVLASLYFEFVKSIKRLGIKYCEAGTILENNLPSLSPLRNLGAKESRIYRIYYKELN